MVVGYESLSTLGRAHLGFCEQLARLALESFERTHRINLDAYKAFWERRIAETNFAVGNAPQATLGDAPAPASLAHWMQVSETASYLWQEFGRLASEYAEDVKNAVSAAPDAAHASYGVARADRVKAPNTVAGALAKAA